MTPEDTPRMAERTDRQAQIDPWERLTSFRMRHGNGMLVDAYPKVSADAAVAALLRERDAQIARLTEQVERQTTALRSIAQWCPLSAPGTDWQGSGNYDDAYNAGSDDAYWAMGQIALAALGCTCPACVSGGIHDSDCGVHNMPAASAGPCDCAEGGMK